MARPRRIVPGGTYLVTRRVAQRTFRLRPNAQTDQIARYCLAWAAAKMGILVHAFVLMSNHHHLVISDPMGRLPDFLREFHRAMAKALNASQGQRENLWSAEHASAVLLPTLDDVLDKVAYTATNPVAAALVGQPGQWPGVLHWEPGTSMRVQRPAAYFSPRGSAPEWAELQFVAPLGVADEPETWSQRVRQAVTDKVHEAQASVRKQGLAFLGAATVVAKSFLERAKSYEQKRGINPVLAARNVSVRVAFLRVERAFRNAYRAALAAWTAGQRDVCFPAGTWWMRVHHKARVLPEPT